MLSLDRTSCISPMALPTKSIKSYMNSLIKPSGRKNWKFKIKGSRLREAIKGHVRDCAFSKKKKVQALWSARHRAANCRNSRRLAEAKHISFKSRDHCRDKATRLLFLPG